MLCMSTSGEKYGLSFSSLGIVKCLMPSYISDEYTYCCEVHPPGILQHWARSIILHYHILHVNGIALCQPHIETPGEQLSFAYDCHTLRYEKVRTALTLTVTTMLAFL